MVEMLGVPAIIGVLSVGGITGYTKAMEKYYINKFTSERYNHGGNKLGLRHLPHHVMPFLHSLDEIKSGTDNCARTLNKKRTPLLA